MKIEFDNHTIEAPENWSQVTLGDYEKWSSKQPENNRELIEYVADVCKTDVEILLNAPAPVFDTIYNSIQFLFENEFEPVGKCTMNETDFIVSGTGEMTLGEYVDVDGILSGDSENKFSEILATLCRPEGEKYNPDNVKLFDERVEMFKNLPCSEALPLISFFLLKRKKSMQILNHCSTVTTQANRFLKDMETFVTNGDGIRQLPIWHRIRCIYWMRLLKRRLSKFSDSYYTESTKHARKRNSIIS